MGLQQTLKALSDPIRREILNLLKTREGKFIFYEINTSVLEETMLWLADLKGDCNDDQTK